MKKSKQQATKLMVTTSESEAPRSREQVLSDIGQERYVRRVRELVAEVGMKRAQQFLRLPEEEIEKLLNHRK